MGYVQTPVAKWLDAEYVKWRQKQTGRRKAGITHFAQWLGVSRDTLNNWLGGRRVPERENIELLAAKLGLEIYDVMGLPRPDPNLQLIIESWGRVSENVRARVVEIVRRATGQDGMRG